MATPTTAGVLTMKLLIDTNSRRVLFAEAGKDAVDFLFSLLSLPLATAAALLGTGTGASAAVAGSVGALYASVERLDDSYVLPDADRDALLRPALAASPAATAASSLLLLPPPPAKAFFRCCTLLHGVNCSRYVTDAGGAACPSCRSPMTAPLRYVSPPSKKRGSGGGSGQSVPPTPNAAAAGKAAAARGFVRGVVTYTVTDDLTVTPMSAISSITLLNAFAVRDIAALQEKTVQLGYNEGLEILKASLQSKTVLTDVFLGKASSVRA